MISNEEIEALKNDPEFQENLKLLEKEMRESESIARGYQLLDAKLVTGASEDEVNDIFTFIVNKAFDNLAQKLSQKQKFDLSNPEEWATARAIYDLDRFYGAYKKFIDLAQIKVLNCDDEFLDSLELDNVIKFYPSKELKDIEYIIRDLEPYTRFKIDNLGEFEVWGFGEHIALDSALAIKGAIAIGEDVETLRARMLNYRGIKKRFDIVYDDGDLIVIDDYGHHPTEIKATLEAIRLFADARGVDKIYAIWQPHKYSRTIDNLKGFVECFDGVDELTILPIWSAGEIEIPIDLKGAFSRYSPVMADYVDRDEESVIVVKNGKYIKEYKKGLVVAFGAGDITYQIRGEK